MTIALPILLLIFGALTFWLLSESKLNPLLKIFSVATYCLFTILFFLAMPTLLGWGCFPDQLPEKLKIYAVTIKEPSKVTNTKGGIYIVIEAPETKYSSVLLRIVGYSKNKSEPRLFWLPYSRKLHEQMVKEVMPKLAKGQAVYGSMKKDEGTGRKGDSKLEGKGKGSESNFQEWIFHNLLPTEIQPKPEN